MTDIRIYGSQGQPLDSDTEPPDQRIQDFFFDGVRLGIQDKGNQVEATVFFRARESEASRSEQYYAVYRANSIRDIGRGFHADLVDLVEGKYDMELVTSTDDTTIFQLLVENEQGRTPTNSRDLDDLKTLMRDSPSNSLGGSSESTLGIKDEATQTGVRAPKPVKIGVGSYQLAFGVLLEVTADAGSVVIAENADSSRLSDFGVVIEEGPYTGMTLLGETERAVENLRERRRQRRQPAGAAASDPGLVGRHKKKMYAVGGVFGVVLIAVVALYGSALLGSPLVDGLPLMSDGSGGDDGGGGTIAPRANLSVDNWVYNSDSNSGRLTFTLSANGSLPQNATVKANLSSQTNKWTDQWTVTDGNYRLTIENATLATNTTYRFSVNVTYENGKMLSTETSLSPDKSSTSTPPSTPSNPSSTPLNQVTIENVRYDSESDDITFELANLNASLHGNVTMDVLRRNGSETREVKTNVTVSEKSQSFPATLSPGEYTLLANISYNETTKRLNASFDVSETTTTQPEIRFTQEPSYDPATRQVTFRLGSKNPIPANATLKSMIARTSHGDIQQGKIDSEMNVTISEGLDPGTHTLNVTLETNSTIEPIHSTFNVTTRPLSVDVAPAPTYHPTNRNVSFTIRSIGESVPDDANVTVVVKERESTRANQTYSFAKIQGESQQLYTDVLEVNTYDLEVSVSDPTFNDTNETTTPFYVPKVYLAFNNGPSHNESSGRVTFDLTNEMHNRRLPDEVTMDVSVRNGTEVFSDSINVTNGKYPSRIDPDPKLSDGHYELVVNVTDGDQTYTTTGTFVNRKTELAFADGPDYNAMANRTTFNMTNAAEFDLPEETTMTAKIIDADSRRDIYNDDFDVTNGNYTQSIDEFYLEKGTYDLEVTIDDDTEEYTTTKSFDNREVSLAFSGDPEYDATSGEVTFNLTNAAEEFDLPEETTMKVKWFDGDFPTGNPIVVNVTNGTYNRSIAFDEGNGTYTADVQIKVNGKTYSVEQSFVKRNVSLNVSYGPTYDESARELSLNLTNDANSFDLPQTNSMNVTITNGTEWANSTTLSVTNEDYNRTIGVDLSDGNYTVYVTIESHSAPITVTSDLTVEAGEPDQQNVARRVFTRARAT